MPHDNLRNSHAILRDAVKVGAEPGLSDDVSADLWTAARHVVEPLRHWGAHAAERPAASEDGPAATLLRHLGRNPHWTPSA